MPHQLLARGLCWFAMCFVVCGWSIIKIHMQMHADNIRVESFFVSVHLPKFFGSENLDDAASAINEYTNQRDLDVFSYIIQFFAEKEKEGHPSFCGL
ncbi:hypothetical protein DKX38_013627 [Salix brachista]|uniref:Uncharacterized protein n=1 Tax=Salix brachista TaxID=2182728 RepID=A0A5N5LD78_9ROSI|nr:hypothetical protein DKX38_013627 [Salix brachista]